LSDLDVHAIVIGRLVETMPAFRILLADDHDLIRQVLANLVDSQPDMEVVGQAGDGLEALSLARDLRPDLIVMDISMPICNGLEATKLIRKQMPDARILILTVHDEDEKLFEAIKAGARGYLLKNSNATTFLQAVRSILAGEAVLPPRLALRLVDEFARLANRRMPEELPRETYTLTSREQEILNRIATGASDKEIAADLTISLNTVKTHVRGILNKLQAINRRTAVRVARQKGLLDG